MIDVPPPDDAAVSPLELAARLAARLCHDFISPASAIVSGLDLIEDPDQQDMREEAMSLIASSARKLAAVLAFSRTAFGGSASAEVFDVRELEKLSRDLFEHARAELDWAAAPAGLDKPAARAVLNLVQLGAAVLPMGGVARIAAETAEGRNPPRPRRRGAARAPAPGGDRRPRGPAVRRGPGRQLGAGLLPACPGRRRRRPYGVVGRGRRGARPRRSADGITVAKAPRPHGSLTRPLR